MTINRAVTIAQALVLLALVTTTTLGAPAVDVTQRNLASAVRQEDDAPENPGPSPSVSPPPLPVFNPADPAELERHFAVSKNAPMTKALAGPLSESYWRLIQFVEHIERAVVFATNASRNGANGNSDNDVNDDSLTPFDDNSALLTTCNHRNDGWQGTVETYFGVRGIKPPDLGCISDVYGSQRADGIWYPDRENGDVMDDAFSPNAMYTKIFNHSSAVQNRSSEVIQQIGGDLKDWERAIPTRARDFQYDVRTQSCSYDYVGFMKVSRTWYVVERITNADKDVVLGADERRFIYEFIRPGSPPLTMRVRNESTMEYEYGVTTSQGKYTGGVTGSSFDNIFPSDNLAVERALQRGEHQTQQASDATTPSNIAILAFPLVMNVVPVALIAEVNSFGMLVYTLLTDVLTAVPLAIKGIEVLVTGAKSNRAIVTRITGANLPPNDASAAKAAECWVAECKATGSFRVTGVTLLVVALAFMVGGVIAEFGAKRWVERRALLLAQQQQQQQHQQHQQQYASHYGGEAWDMGDKPLLSASQGLELESQATSTALSAAAPSSANAAFLVGAGLNARQHERDRIHQSGAASDFGSAPGSRSSSGTQQISPPPSIGARGPFDFQGSDNPKKTA